jgi:hypothetical protein
LKQRVWTFISAVADGCVCESFGATERQKGASKITLHHPFGCGGWHHLTSTMITLYGLSRPMMSWFSETYVASKLHVHSRDLTTVPPRTCLMCPFRYHYQFSSLIHFKTRQEYFFYDKESYGMLKTGFGGTWFSTLLLNFSKGNGSKWGTWPTTTPLCPIIIAMIFFIKM